MKERAFFFVIGLLLTSCTYPTHTPLLIDVHLPVERFDRMQCDSIQDCYLQARKTYLKGDHKEAAALLHQLLAEPPGPPWEGRARLLLARTLESSGDSITAVGYYQTAAEELPELGDYILFSVGQLYLDNGQFVRAAAVWEGLHRHYPDSPLKSQALYQAADAYIQAGEGTKAIESFERFLRLFPDDPKVASAFYLLGKAYLQRYETDRAVELFRKVVWQYPQESVAISARVELESLAAQGVVIPAPTPTERFQQAKALYRAARYREAAQAFQESLRSALDPKAREESSLYLGISLVQLRRWPEAMKAFEILLKNHPGRDVAGETLSWFGKAALRQGDLDRLQWVYNTLKAAYPERSERARALWYLAAYYESKKEDQKAIQACWEIIKSFPQDSLAQDAYWRIGWIHYKQGRLQEALKVFDEMMQRYTNTAFRPQVLYWKARLLEDSGSPQRAQEVYTRLCQEHARTFYCHRTRDHQEGNLIQWWDSSSPPILKASQTGLSKVEPETQIPPVLVDDHQYQKARELMLVGFLEEAALEMADVVGRYTNNQPTLLFLADQLYDLGSYNQALRIIRQYFQEALEKGTLTMPDHFWVQAYPLGMMDRITKHIGSDRLNPYLVASIIREESMYDPKAISMAGAVGLMQVMPETGRWVAAQLGLKGFEPDQLFDLDLNIKLGSWYLAHLFEQFKGNLVFTIAAYNAGPDAVTEWIQRGDFQDMDEFIEQIPYSETRLYVKKVLRSYYEYLMQVSAAHPVS
jgi:soluble lytic murein transglycosylase